MELVFCNSRNLQDVDLKLIVCAENNPNGQFVSPICSWAQTFWISTLHLACIVPASNYIYKWKMGKTFVAFSEYSKCITVKEFSDQYWKGANNGQKLVNSVKERLLVAATACNHIHWTFFTASIIGTTCWKNLKWTFVAFSEYPKIEFSDQCW